LKEAFYKVVISELIRFSVDSLKTFFT